MTYVMDLTRTEFEALNQMVASDIVEAANKIEAARRRILDPESSQERRDSGLNEIEFWTKRQYMLTKLKEKFDERTRSDA